MAKLGETSMFGGIGVPLKGTGPARKTKICSIPQAVGLHSGVRSEEARKIRRDPSLPGFLLGWSTEIHKVGPKNARRFGVGEASRSRGMFISSIPGVRRSFYPQSLELRKTEIRIEEMGEVGTLTLGKWPLMLTKPLFPTPPPA